MLALGDALAMALLHARGFAAEDFAQYHPEGALGRRLLLRARDVMRRGAALPLVAAQESFDKLLLEMTRKQLGLALLVEPDGRLLGTFTDGDLRRIFERVANPRELTARAAHAASRRNAQGPPVRVSTVTAHVPAVECLRLMRQSAITALIVVDEADHPIGVLRLLDLLEAGLS
jgi:arabinose-5-phosphate isomerase